MVWFRVDDGFWSHPKVLPLTGDALALWVRAGAYCGQQLTDGFVSLQALRMLGERDAAVELANAGLWDSVKGGFQFHDWAEYQPTRAQIMAERASSVRRQELSRNPRLRDAIRERDGDFCRFCGKRVSWNDRKSNGGGTYNLLDPSGPSAFENVVVACRGCATTKGDRTPDQADMTLLGPRSVSRTDLDQVIPGAGRDARATPVDPTTLPRFCPKHMPEGPQGRPCGGCRDARFALEAAQAAAKAKPSTTPFTVAPGSLCPDGQHQMLADGTCTRCEYRGERSA